MRSYDFQLDPTPEGDDHSAVVDPPAEVLSMSHLDDGRWQLRGELDADHGAVLDAALREAHDALFQRDGVRASRVDALVEIAHRSLDTVSDIGRRDRHRVHVHLDVDNAMLDGLGHRLPVWLRDLICCDTILPTARAPKMPPVRR